MKIKLSSIMVDDQAKALSFYTEVLGFVKRHDIRSEFGRLKARGVVFTKEPTQAGPVTIAVFADTCGNFIQIYQVAA